MIASPKFPVLFAVLVSLITAVTATPVRALATIIEIDMEAGLLTLKARDAPLSEVVLAIGERVGFETILVGDFDIPVSASFTKLPIRKALEQLLGDTNRVVVYDKGEDAADRNIVRLWLLESDGTAGDTAVTATEHDVLEDDFQDTDAKIRSEAVLKLANAGATEQVLETLFQALRDDDDALVRSRAAIALGKLGDERAVPALDSALLDEHSSVRTQVIHALGQIGSDSATMALGDILLHSEDNKERVIAAWGLGKQDTELARQYLDAVANDPDEQVRAASQQASGQGEPRIIEIPARSTETTE